MSSNEKIESSLWRSYKYICDFKASIIVINAYYQDVLIWYKGWVCLCYLCYIISILYNIDDKSSRQAYCMSWWHLIDLTPGNLTLTTDTNGLI